MYLCKIYDAAGTQTNQFEIDDDLRHINGRVAKGERFYYKGVGSPYRSHYVKQYPEAEYDLIRHTTVFYLGDEVSKKCFAGKTGIFEEQYQPHLSDMINGCGVKELSLIENSIYFKRSSVEVVKSKRIDHDKYYFVLNYRCGRKKYDYEGDPAQLRALIDYMVTNDWNFIWDKQAIADISWNGLVTDVADIFHSKELMSKIGTVYAVLHSIGKNPPAYRQLLDEYGLSHENEKSYVYNTLSILRQNDVDVGIWLDDFDDAAYRDIVLNYLIIGRNCGHCSFEDLGERIKEAYLATVQNKWIQQNYVDRPQLNSSLF